MSDAVSASRTEIDAETAAVDPPAETAELHLSVGNTLGRYVVLEAVGQGAMGRVLRAYDPKLQREVALKIVRTATADPEARARMLREARAMAKLSHPNVVAVYDAEESPAGVMLVMEYIDGQTLRQWVRAEDRPWRELLDRFGAAGRGLAAAHAEGLLHRDFKPANVLVAHSGAVKVTDFGLAKLAPEREPSPAPSSIESISSDSLSGELTRGGTVLGTPRYMAPEQHLGEALTPAADQYGFCVAAWEALVGNPPFGARPARKLLHRKLDGPPTWPGPDPVRNDTDAVPRRIAEALRRGMAPRPDERWPSMDALLEELEQGAQTRRTGRWLAAAGIAALGLGAISIRAWSDARAQRCSGAADELAGVWDSARRSEVERAFSGTGTSYAGDVLARILPQLDAYSSGWVTMHTETCEATTIRGEQSAELMDLRMTCLRRAKLGLEAATGVLAGADADVVQKAHEVVAGLPPLDRCADVEALQAEVEPPPPEEAGIVEAIRADLAEARASTEAGDYAAARADLEQAKARLAEVEYEPIATEVAAQHGWALASFGEYEAAAEALRGAVRSGATHGQWALAGEAATELLTVVGARLEQPEAALGYLELAEGLARGDVRAEAGVASGLGQVRDAQGEYAEAEAEDRRALSLLEETLGPDDPAVATARNNLANVLHARGEYGEAAAEHQRVLETYRRVLGPAHPLVAAALNNVGAELFAQGEYAEAEAAFREAAATWERAAGPDHPGIGDAHNNLANTLKHRGLPGEAEAEYRMALAVWQRSLGPDHPKLAMVRSNLGNVLQDQKRYEEAEVEGRLALGLVERALGPDHPNAALSHNNLAAALYGQGKHAEAEAEYRTALPIWEHALGPDHPFVAQNRINLAEVLLDRGETDEALQLAELAWARLQKEDVPGPDRANAAFVLARVLWARSEAAPAPADRAGLRTRARELAADALAALDEHDDAGTRSKVDRWLREHRGAP